MHEALHHRMVNAVSDLCIQMNTEKLSLSPVRSDDDMNVYASWSIRIFSDSF